MSLVEIKLRKVCRVTLDETRQTRSGQGSRTDRPKPGTDLWLGHSDLQDWGMKEAERGQPGNQRGNLY